MNKASIPPPPNGGTLTCPNGCVPIVSRNKRTGAITAECVDASSAGSIRAVGNIILERLFGTPRRPEQPISPEHQRLLQRGRYEDDEREYSFDISDQLPQG